MADPVQPVEKGPHSGFQRMSLAEFRESGLLWHVNQAVLWPLGLALTVVVDGDSYGELFVQKLEPFDSIVDGATSEERADVADRLRDWMKERVR